MKSLYQIREALEKMPNMSEMARDLKVTPSYIAAIKRGERLNPSVDLHERMSDWLEQRGY